MKLLTQLAGVIKEISLVSFATGGSTDKVFYLNDTVVTANYTIPTGQNAGTFGPITINNGVTVTVPNGSVWSIV